MIKKILTPPPYPYAPGADTPNASAQDAGSTDSYIPYPLINYNQHCKITPNIKKLPPTLMPLALIPPIILTMMLLILNQITFPCKFSIKITKSPPTPKKTDTQH